MDLSKPILAIFTLLVFATAVLISIHTATMTDSHGNMSSCPLMDGSTSLCRMTIMEHLNTWQSLFAAAIPNIITLLLVSTILLIGVFSNIDERNRHATINFLYNKHRGFIVFIFNHLRLAFSRGILHSKVYDFASVSS